MAIASSPANGPSATTVPLSSTLPAAPLPSDPLPVPVPAFVDVLLQQCTHANVSAPTRRLAAAAEMTHGLPRIRHGLHILRTRSPPGISVLAVRTDAHAELVEMIRDPHHVFQAASDKAAVVVAAHTLCSHPVFRDAFVDVRGLHALCALLRPCVDTAVTSDRIVGTPVFPVSARVSPSHRLTSSSESDSFSGLDLTADKVHRVVWNAAIRTIAKLLVCSTAACAQAISTGALALLAQAARPMQPMDVRLRAAAGLAAMAAWSGPRRALEIVHTEGVVLAMTAILTEQDERIPGDLRSATIDGLVVMSFRRHARLVLQKHGCEDKIRAAARHAGLSGDYTAAAKTTVAAGQFTGRSIDEYGFLVEEASNVHTDDENRNSLTNGDAALDAAADVDAHMHADAHAGIASNDDTPAEMDADDRAAEPLGKTNDSTLKRRPTGLDHIQQKLVEEPYTSMDDLNVLEEIVHEEAGVLSSSPRDRHYIRRAARMQGMSADEIEFMSILRDEPSPPQFDNDDAGHVLQKTVSTTRKGSNDKMLSPQKLALQPAIFAEVRENARGSGQSYRLSGEARMSDRPNSALSITLAELVEQAGSSSPQRSSNLMSLRDPDFDRDLKQGDESESASSANAVSGKSKMLSPLLMFSSATKQAAEKNEKNILLRKTSSQLSRDTEHERFWKKVISSRPEMLRRERGRASRVVAYRELAMVPVPPQMRRKLWPILLDTASLREARPELYKKLCKAADQGTLPDDTEHTIEADVTRTMPLHSLFWAGGAQVGVQSLRSILRAYARYVPEVGYCQGMSSIAAVFLMNAADEEEAFLMMAQFMTRFQYKKVFAPGFPLMLQWVDELKPLVAHYMPELNARLDRENVPLEIYADKWLITALSHNFPHRYLLRVWDLMFLGGSPKIILKACLAVLRKCEPQLMEMDFETMMPFLQRRFAEPEEGVLDPKNVEEFITMTREFRFMPDIPKSQLRTSSERRPSKEGEPVAVEKTKKRRFASCLPCFRASATVD